MRSPAQRDHWRRLQQMGQLVMIRKILNSIPEARKTIYSGPFKSTDRNDIDAWLCQLTLNLKDRK